MSTKIVRLESQNVKRLKAVEITPAEGELVVVGGKNGAGKTSVLDSIMYALAGKSSIPERAKREGSDKARVAIELDGDSRLVVERRWTDKGSTLEITQPTDDGNLRVSSPQSLLDKLCNKIAFDPMQFVRLDSKQQSETLRQIVGIDFTELNQGRQSLYEQRTNANRRVKELHAQLNSMPQLADAPESVIDVAELMAELKRAQEENQIQQQRQRAVLQQQQVVEDFTSHVADVMKQLEAAREQLNAAKLHLTEFQVEAEEGTVVDTADLEERISSAAAQNDKLRANRHREETATELSQIREQANSLSQQIDDIDDAKNRLLLEADWPVEGLGFDDQGVTYRGLPFANASAAEQMRVSVAMGIALHPRLPVFLIRDGSLLDGDSLQLLADLACEHDAQFWIERVGEGTECSVIIEDGGVKGVAD